LEPIYQENYRIPAKNEKLEVHMPDPRGGTMVFMPTILVAEVTERLDGLAGQKEMYLMGNIVFR
jgi:hypothetical protein